jgi:hypothetical protein
LYAHATKKHPSFFSVTVFLFKKNYFEGFGVIGRIAFGTTLVLMASLFVSIFMAWGALKLFKNDQIVSEFKYIYLTPHMFYNIAACFFLAMFFLRHVLQDKTSSSYIQKFSHLGKIKFGTLFAICSLFLTVLFYKIRFPIRMHRGNMEHMTFYLASFFLNSTVMCHICSAYEKGHVFTLRNRDLFLVFSFMNFSFFAMYVVGLFCLVLAFVLPDTEPDLRAEKKDKA